ncbi:MAG: transporter permease protein [Chloroflexi bacterium]|nr:transporter permease protein [Chloroflexota bacterium]
MNEHAATSLSLAGVEEVDVLPRRRRRWLARSNAGLYIGGSILAVVLVCIAIPSVIAPGDPLGINLAARLLAPGAPGHLLGTDPLGRDVSRLIVHGAAPSILIALVAVLFAGAVGVTLGMVSGYFGGWVDGLIMRWTDIQLSFPFILLALVVLSLFGTGMRNLILVLALGGWMDYARVVRSQVLTTRAQTYVMAAVAMGAGSPRVLVRHILPSVLSSVIVLVTLNLSINILFEAALTFLGLGISPQTPTWGGMLSDGRVYLSTAWWIATFPGLAIMLSALAINIVGDWLRDVLDPRLSRGGRA